MLQSIIFMFVLASASMSTFEMFVTSKLRSQDELQITIEKYSLCLLLKYRQKSVIVTIAKQINWCYWDMEREYRSHSSDFDLLISTHFFKYGAINIQTGINSAGIELQ